MADNLEENPEIGVSAAAGAVCKESKNEETEDFAAAIQKDKTDDGGKSDIAEVEDGFESLPITTITTSGLTKTQGDLEAKPHAFIGATNSALGSFASMDKKPIASRFSKGLAKDQETILSSALISSESNAKESKSFVGAFSSPEKDTVGEQSNGLSNTRQDLEAKRNAFASASASVVASSEGAVGTLPAKRDSDLPSLGLSRTQKDLEAKQAAFDSTPTASTSAATRIAASCPSKDHLCKRPAGLKDNKKKKERENARLAAGVGFTFELDTNITSIDHTASPPPPGDDADIHVVPEGMHQEEPGFISEEYKDDQSTQKMAVARAVEGGSVRYILPEAQPVDADLQDKALRRSTVQQRQRGMLYMLAMIVIIAVAVVVPIVLLLGGKSEDATEISGSSSVLSETTLAPSTAPSTTPSTTPLIADLPPITLRALVDPFSPQSQAYFVWLPEHPDIDNMDDWRKKQLMALVTIYYELNGDNWPEKYKTSWLQHDKHECHWYTNLDELAFDTTNACDEGVQIIEALSLTLGGVSGTMPPEIAFLSSLESINLEMSGNLANLMGAPYLTEMENLTFLDYWSLSGTIPSDIGHVKSLQRIDLSHNNTLTGHIPSEVGELGNLKVLYLHDNLLNGTLPTELALATNLVRLRVQNNDIVGPVPSEFGQLLDIREISLQNNSLLGLLPSELGRLPFLEILDMSDNNLSTTIPTEYGFLTGLSRLNLSFNLLSGTIPRSLAAMGPRCDLVLTGNFFSGVLPSELCPWFCNGDETKVGKLEVDCSGALQCNCAC